MLSRIFLRKFPKQKRLILPFIQIPVLLVLLWGVVSLMGNLKKQRPGGAIFGPSSAPAQEGTATPAKSEESGGAEAEKAPVLRKARFLPPMKRPAKKPKNPAP